ncbi:MAG: hypothetical protein QOF84_6321 [Streptomyces sp.]|nr:hypothetical protein [Streptomyces sp.]
MAVVTRRRAWSALPIVLVLAVLTGLLLPRLATASTPDPASASTNAVTSTASTYANNFTNVTDVYTDTASHGDGTRVPDIVSTSADHAVVAWREGIVPGHVDQGYIRYSYTTDGGKSWSQPQVLAQETTTFTYNDVVLYHTGNQVFAYLDRAKAGGANKTGTPDTLVVKRSTDEGHSWESYALDTDSQTTMNGLIISGHPLQSGSNYVIPYWKGGPRPNGVLTSADLKTWTLGKAAENNGTVPGENQIAVSQDNAQELVMVARAKSPGGNAATATSEDGGKTWSAFAEDPNLPSYDVAKDFFTKDSDGQYLYIYNPGRAGITSADPDYRDQLFYKVKPQGKPWSAAAPLIDTVLNDPAQPGCPSQPQCNGAGWDTYPMADEYAPGKFYVVWEADTMHIMVGKLDISGTAD